MRYFLVILFLICSSVFAAEISGRPDRRPIDDRRIVSQVRIYNMPGYAFFNPNKQKHAGIDWSCYVDTPIYAVADGEIVWSRNTNGYGDLIIIKHDWINNGKAYTAYSVYGHLQEYKKLKGTKVKKGDLIALSGNTGRSEGPHLHYELRDGNENPIWNGTYQAEKLRETKKEKELIANVSK